jgi:hypothetical protein
VECINILLEKVHTHIELQIIISFGQKKMLLLSGKQIQKDIRHLSEHDPRSLANFHPFEMAFIKIEDSFT